MKIIEIMSKNHLKVIVDKFLDQRNELFLHVKRVFSLGYFVNESLLDILGTLSVYFLVFLTHHFCIILI